MCATDLGPGVPSAGGCPELGERVRALVDVVRALSPPPSEVAIGELRREIRSADVTDRDVVGTLIAVGPVVGATRLVAAAHTVARLIGYDVDEDLERPPI